MTQIYNQQNINSNSPFERPQEEITPINQATTKKKSRWVLGLFITSIIVITITLPIVFLTGGKNTFNSKQEAWSVQKSDSSGKTTSNWFFASAGYEGTMPKEVKTIIEELSANTFYTGWYSNVDYRHEVEFVNFVNVWNPKIENAIDYSISILEDLPTLPNNPTSSTITNFYSDIQEYLTYVGYNETYGFYHTIDSAYQQFLNSTYSDDFGIMMVDYLKLSDEYYYISCGYYGSITIYDNQIELGSSKLPEVYSFDNDLMNGATDLLEVYFEWTFENIEGIITEYNFNSKFPDAPLSFNDTKKIAEKYKSASEEFSYSNIV